MASQSSPKPAVTAPAAVDLDEDISNRTPSGWPMQSQPPPLEVCMAGRRYRLQQGRTNEGLHALLWPVSRLLVRYVEANAAVFRGARVLELGAGVGLAGIGAAAYGAHVLLTDKLTGLTETNVAAAAATGVSGSVSCAELDWTGAEAWLSARAAAGASNAFDVVLGADIVYHQQFDFGPVRALAALLAALLRAAPGAQVILGYQERDSAARLAFFDAMRAAGLTWRERGLEELAAEGVDTTGLSGPMVMWWVTATDEEVLQDSPQLLQAHAPPAEAPPAEATDEE